MVDSLTENVIELANGLVLSEVTDDVCHEEEVKDCSLTDSEEKEGS